MATRAFDRRAGALASRGNSEGSGTRHATLRVATGATMRQACTAAGIDPDADSLIVGIPGAAF